MTSLQAMFALALLVAFAMQLWRRARGTTRFIMRRAAAGLLLFRERLSRLNLAGVALAAVAIGVLARG